MKAHWIVLGVVLLALLFGCLAQTPQKDAKAQLTDLLTKARNTPWSGEYTGEGAGSPSGTEYYLNETNYRVDNVVRGRAARFIRKENISYSCFDGVCDKQAGYTDIDSPFLADPSKIKDISAPRVSYIGSQEVAGVNGSCYNVNTSGILLPGRGEINPSDGGDYWILYCFAPDGVLLKQAERFFGHWGYSSGPAEISTSITHYSLNVSEKDLELPGQLGQNTSTLPIQNGTAVLNNSQVAPTPTAPLAGPMACEDYRLHFQKWALLGYDNIWTLHGDNVSLDNISVEYVGWEMAQNLTINGQWNWNHPAQILVMTKDGQEILNMSLPEEMKTSFQDPASGKTYVVKLFQLVENFALGSGAYAEMDVERADGGAAGGLEVADCSSTGNTDWTTAGFEVKQLYTFNESQMHYWPAGCHFTELDISSGGKKFSSQYLYDGTKTIFEGPDNKTYQLTYCGQNRVRITPIG